ncbi:MAG: hypothetical protein ACWIPH_10065 [Ostreibacterium sp.]
MTKTKKENHYSLGDDFVYDNFLAAKRSAKLAWIVAIYPINLKLQVLTLENCH